MNVVPTLSPLLQQRLQSELRGGEAIKWVGQPSFSNASKSEMVRWLFFIPWTAFSIFWMFAAAGFKMPTFDTGMSWFPLFGIPFLLIGLGGLSAPLWKRVKTNSTIYAVTNQRLILIEGTKNITTNSYVIADIAHIERTERADGSGDLIFRKSSVANQSQEQFITEHGFFGIPNVKQVHDLIQSQNSVF